jgi:Zn-dependent M16 (insulinase) family peptidase
MPKTKSDKLQKRHKKATDQSLERLINDYEQAKVSGNTQRASLLKRIIDRVKNDNRA